MSRNPLPPSMGFWPRIRHNHHRFSRISSHHRHCRMVGREGSPMKKYKCENCGVLNKIPEGAPSAMSSCWPCARPLTNAKEATGDTSAAVGMVGGAAVGASSAAFGGASSAPLSGASLARRPEGWVDGDGSHGARYHPRYLSGARSSYSWNIAAVTISISATISATSF
uniref:Uncharacterized protein n=1 Tax=Candidatus Kentrum sp. TC TaxID=2126339 RepID=A0A450YZ30_9GAMM|nr:MAG: hypothetical protein BECKTC1821E_GA0114239_107010 [Candidatus Kentron sp. TC]